MSALRLCDLASLTWRHRVRDTHSGHDRARANPGRSVVVGLMSSGGREGVDLLGEWLGQGQPGLRGLRVVIVLLRPCQGVPKVGAGGRRRGHAAPSSLSDIAGSERKCSATTSGVTRRTLGLSSEPNQVAARRLRRWGLPVLLRPMRVRLPGCGGGVGPFCFTKCVSFCSKQITAAGLTRTSSRCAYTSAPMGIGCGSLLDPPCSAQSVSFCLQPSMMREQRSLLHSRALRRFTVSSTSAVGWSTSTV
jgi:hypothetical protein